MPYIAPKDHERLDALESKWNDLWIKEYPSASSPGSSTVFHFGVRHGFISGFRDVEDRLDWRENNQPTDGINFASDRFKEIGLAPKDFNVMPDVPPCDNGKAMLRHVRHGLTMGCFAAAVVLAGVALKTARTGDMPLSGCLVAVCAGALLKEWGSGGRNGS